MTKNDDASKACHIDVLVEERDEKTRAKARPSWQGEALSASAWRGRRLCADDRYDGHYRLITAAT